MNFGVSSNVAYRRSSSSSSSLALVETALSSKRRSNIRQRVKRRRHPKCCSGQRISRLKFYSKKKRIVHRIIFRIIVPFLLGVLLGALARRVHWMDKSNATHLRPSQIRDAQTNRMREDMIDFAVLGFEKCGTTWLKEYVLGRSPDIYIPNGHSGTAEVHDLERDELESFASLFEDGIKQQERNSRPSTISRIIAFFLPTEEKHNTIPSSPSFHFPHALPRIGYKSPGGLKKDSSLRNLEFFAPHLRLLVTTRHPVWWFQSIYNYRLMKRGHLPPPSELIGHCGEDCIGIVTPKQGECLKSEGVGICTGAANFHHFLSRLGWTQMKSERELDLLEHHLMSVHSFPKARMFFMEQSQINGKNLTVTNQVLHDLEVFLNLPMKSLPRLNDVYRADDYPSSQNVPLVDALPSYNASNVQENKISICDEVHRPIRQELTRIGSQAAQWISEFFLPSPHVFVSNPADLEDRLKLWSIDPC